MSTHHEVHRVTDAPTTQAEDMKPRMLKYGISMGFRIVFFPIAVFLLDGWIRIAAMIIVLVLPWIAVVIANAGRETTPHSDDLMGTPGTNELREGGAGDDPTVIRGEFVDGPQDGTGKNGRRR